MPRNSTSAAFAMCDPSIPPADGHGFFFTLPLELRDIISEYALAADHGLIAQNGRALGDLVLRNNFYYTNKQLRAETKGLLLGLNDLTFPATTAQRGTDVAITFLAQCGDTTKARLGKIHAYYGEAEEYFPRWAIFQMIRDAGPFSQHCSRYQRSRVLVYLPVKKDAEFWGWIGLMNKIQRLIRGRSIFTGLSAWLDVGWGWLEQILTQEWLADVKRVPENLRIVPSERLEITTESLAKSARNRGTSRKSLDGLVAAANKIFEEGL